MMPHTPKFVVWRNYVHSQLSKLTACNEGLTALTETSHSEETVFVFYFAGGTHSCIDRIPSMNPFTDDAGCFFI